MVVGLTGGIACGKSTVSAMLAARGARVVDADAIARDVVAAGTDGLAEVIAAFGRQVLDASGVLDRGRLAARVFDDTAARRRLEAILHPRIAAESVRRIASAIAVTPPLVVYDAALLIESGRADQFRPLIVVIAPADVQRARLMARDGLTAADADARVTSQMPVAEKAARADYLIDNSGPVSSTQAQVDALWARLTQRADDAAP